MLLSSEEEGQNAQGGDVEIEEADTKASRKELSERNIFWKGRSRGSTGIQISVMRKKCAECDRKMKEQIPDHEQCNRYRIICRVCMTKNTSRRRWRRGHVRTTKNPRRDGRPPAKNGSEQ